MLGTYSGVRIVRSATGLQEQEEHDEFDELMTMSNDSPPPEQLVTVLINRNNNSSDSRMRNWNLMGRPRESNRPSRSVNIDVGPVAETMVFIGNRQRHNNRSNSNVHSTTCLHRYQVPADHKIHKNYNRLTHFIEEANVGRGFIKELCYSNDGRIICSPFSHGVRLLSFSPTCDELSTLQPKPPGIKLHEIGTNVSHSNIVLCTKFSPVHPLLVSGCLAGRIVWYQPRL